MKDPELDWIQNATGRLATLYGVERLNEELLCFASWLSLNRYEEDALRKVKTDWKTLVERTQLSIAFSFVGSTECGLFVFDLMITDRAHPNSDVNVVIDLCPCIARSIHTLWKRGTDQRYHSGDPHRTPLYVSSHRKRESS